MRRRQDSHGLRWFVLAAAVAVSFGMWHWAGNIFLPANAVAARASQRPIGNNSDLYPRWLGTRMALLYRRNPYSDEVTREIQIGFYGRPLDPQKPGDPLAREAFVYPLYVVFLLAPIGTLSFHTAQEIFRWVLMFGLACILPLWMYAVKFRPRCEFVIAGIVLMLSTYPAILEFHMQNLAGFVIFLLAAAAALLAWNWHALSGLALAFATIKPEVSWLFILWFIVWAIADYSKRKRLIWSFVGTLVTLIVAAEAILPNWIGEFLAALRTYPTYGTDPNFFQIFLPFWLAKSATTVLLGLTLAMFWRWRKAAEGTIEFGWALAWTAVVTLAVLPKLAAYNQSLLVPALLVLIRYYKATTESHWFARAFMKGVLACQLWQWMVALMLSLCSLVIPVARLLPAAQWPLLTFLALPPMTLMAVVVASVAGRESKASCPRTRDGLRE